MNSLKDSISLKIGINFSELLLKDINVESDRIADEILTLIDTEHEELKRLRIKEIWLGDMQQMRDEALVRIAELNKLLDARTEACRVKNAIIVNLESDLAELMKQSRELEDKASAIKDGITTANGLLYKNGKIISLPDADTIAYKYGYVYAERLVRALKEK
jgi:hypothetical protein